MNRSAAYDEYLIILSIRHEPLGQCNLKEFSNIRSSEVLDCSSKSVVPVQIAHRNSGS